MMRPNKKRIDFQQIYIIVITLFFYEGLLPGDVLFQKENRFHFSWLHCWREYSNK